MKHWLVAIGICLALSGCGSEGPTAKSTGVDTAPGPGSPVRDSSRVQFAAPSISVDESAGSVNIEITRTDRADGAVTVRVQSRDGTAVAGVDYTAVDTTVTFADGDSAPKSVTLTIANDTVDEPDETLYLTLTVQAGDAVRGSTYETLVTIKDDDVSPPTSAPKATLSSVYRHLHIDWTGVTGATSYRVLKSATAGAPFVQVGDDLPATARSTDIEIVLIKEDWLNARYRIAACNSGGCTESDPLSVAGHSMPLIGYLKAGYSGRYQEFGSAIALSADGSVLAVGVPWDGSAATGIGGNPVNGCYGEVPANCSEASGAVYVYTRSGSTWSAPVYIKADNIGTGNGYDEFGASVALSADGTVLAVGAPGESSGSRVAPDETAIEAGAVYVYVRGTDGSWSGPQYLKASNPDAGDRFGSSVALSSDGTVLAVGAPYEDSGTTGVNSVPDNNAFSAGAVYVFARSGASWSDPVYVKASNTHAFDGFGSSVALNSDGSMLAVGAPYEGSPATGVGGSQIVDCGPGMPICSWSSGAVYLYSRSGASWLNDPVYIKSPEEMSSAYFGMAIALSEAADILVVGQPYGGNSGMVHSYVRSGNTWSFGASLASPGLDWAGFGSAVALSRDGHTLAVGAPWDEMTTAHVGAEGDEGAFAGSVYVYKREDAGWSAPLFVKAPNPQAGDSFGSQVALNGDGSTLVVGAPDEDSAATGLNGDQFEMCAGASSVNCAEDSGAVYIY
jgi:hypothetical protein